MNTGDKVLAILGAKALCCVFLVLASTGALGGALGWFLDRSVGWLVVGALVAGIAAIVWRGGAARSRQSKTGSEAAEQMRPDTFVPQPPRLR